ncbi:hypothetical protein EDD36DRAFT_222327 [Exophiala viscosa]|uniref:DUF202 domain-containing protein n=1 Tax=Exophiala viscosa TaxID=2486360 RepID=A0AAN6IG95_9EURO|nr:hypothetical protein EDD36DRAFT_222327 [Exophiala viscosa]
MAEATQRELPPVRHSLSNPSDQEALELDQSQDQPFSTLPVTITDRRTPRIVRWWRSHVSLGVPHAKCRDHLANERTFLGYLRTGQAFAILGVIIAQLMQLQHSLHPNPVLGFFVVSVPLSSVCHGSAILISILGASRFFHWQQEMSRGYALFGGWELHSVAVLTTLVIACLFCLVLAISIKED